MFKGIEEEINLFFNDLNWTFILMFIFVLYGIKYKEEFEWYNKLLNKNQFLKSIKMWLSGFIVGVFFSIFRYLGPDIFNSEYLSQLLRSYMIVIIFNSILSKKINKLEKKE